MSDTLNTMRRKVNSCTKLRTVVRIMKIIAASQIKACQKSALASENYYNNIKNALSAFFKTFPSTELARKQQTASPIGAVVFGTDQGLVGPFNDLLARFVATSLKENKEKKVYVIGERLGGILEGLGLRPNAIFPMPRSAKEIPSTVHELILDVRSLLMENIEHTLILFHNHSVPGQLFEPTATKVLPLNEAWIQEVKQQAWPTRMIPEVLETNETALLLLLKEYLFAAFARSLAESMACENLIRFLSMQKAQKNIDDTLTDLSVNINLLRQSTIDAELFDVISDFSALTEEPS